MVKGIGMLLPGILYYACLGAVHNVDCSHMGEDAGREWPGFGLGSKGWGRLFEKQAFYFCYKCYQEENDRLDLGAYLFRY